MILIRLHITILVLALLSAFNSKAQEVDNSINALDKYFSTSSTSGQSITSHFTNGAIVRTITYDEEGIQIINSFSASAFNDEIALLRSDFHILQEPVVLLNQSYGGLQSVFCSVRTRLVRLDNKDTLNVRSIHSFQLIQSDGWKIQHLVIQNENPWSPISDDLWPKELTASIRNGKNISESQASEPFETYDPNKVYNVSEVDEAPVYPGQKSLFQDLMKSFDVTLQEDESHSPFIIEIAEDGLASLKYVNDLSGSQMESAKSFVNSMLIWFPAIKDKASVRCKMVMYIK